MYEERKGNSLVVSFHKRLSKVEVESCLSNKYYAPPVWTDWEGMDGKPNPILRWDDRYVWLLLKRKDG